MVPQCGQHTGQGPASSSASASQFIAFLRYDVVGCTILLTNTSS
jgi:hypothetical protein